MIKVCGPGFNDCGLAGLTITESDVQPWSPPGACPSPITLPSNSNSIRSYPAECASPMPEKSNSKVIGEEPLT